MKRALVLSVAVVGLSCMLGSCAGNIADSSAGTTTAPTGATIITIPSGAAGKGTAAYGTNPLHVAVGTAVAWHNTDSMAHTATSNNAWDTGSVGPGNYSGPVTISAAGTYTYYCSIHGQPSMSGQIISP